MQATTSKEDLSEPPIIKLPLSTLDNMKMELAWRIDYLLEQVWERLDQLEQLKETLGINNRPTSPLEFDPLQTFGKYC
jgi:hypothetical protein